MQSKRFFSYRVSRAVVTSFLHTKLDTTQVCLSLRLVYQRKTICFLQFRLWEAIFSTSRNKNIKATPNYQWLSSFFMLQSRSIIYTTKAEDEGLKRFVLIVNQTQKRTYVIPDSIPLLCDSTYSLLTRGLLKK